MKKAATDEEKQDKKKEKEELALKFGYALIDGRIEKVGSVNFAIAIVYSFYSNRAVASQY